MQSAIDKAKVVKDILCDILEIEPEQLTETDRFIEDYNADSLRAVEILASLEKKLGISILEKELPNMINFQQVKEVLTRYGW